MSTWAVHPVGCPCGAEFQAQLADGLHITRLPEVRQKILDGTFHTVTCPGCRATGVVHTKTLYTDFQRFHWVAVAPRWMVGDYEAWDAVVTEEFHKNLRVAAPPMITALAGQFVVRLVFGLDALAEKLKAWDAGLDDAAMELVKWRLIQGHPELISPGFRLRLVEADRQRWHLGFSIERPGVPGVTLLDVSLDAYVEVVDRLEEAPEGLFVPGSTFVSLDRLFAGSLAAAWPERQSLRVLRPMRPQDDHPLFSEPPR